MEFNQGKQENSFNDDQNEFEYIDMGPMEIINEPNESPPKNVQNIEYSQ